MGHWKKKYVEVERCFHEAFEASVLLRKELETERRQYKAYLNTATNKWLEAIRELRAEREAHDVTRAELAELQK